MNVEYYPTSHAEQAQLFKFYFKHYNLSDLKPIMPMKLSQLQFKTDILKR